MLPARNKTNADKTPPVKGLAKKTLTRVSDSDDDDRGDEASDTEDMFLTFPPGPRATRYNSYANITTDSGAQAEASMTTSSAASGPGSSRSHRRHAELRAIVKEETKAYKSFVQQFDKRVEIYLKKLSNI